MNLTGEQVKAAVMEANRLVRVFACSLPENDSRRVAEAMNMWERFFLSQLESEQLGTAIDQHVKKSAETVARIPRSQRTILSKVELESEASDE